MCPAPCVRASFHLVARSFTYLLALTRFPPLNACRLPPRIRPSLFAFGTLADGFLPFHPQLEPGRQQQQQQQPASGARGSGAGGSATGGEQGAAAAAGQSGAGSSDGGGRSQLRPKAEAQPPVEIRLCSVVMKAVQVGKAYRPVAFRSAIRCNHSSAAHWLHVAHSRAHTLFSWT